MVGSHRPDAVAEVVALLDERRQLGEYLEDLANFGSRAFGSPRSQPASAEEGGPFFLPSVHRPLRLRRVTLSASQLQLGVLPGLASGGDGAAAIPGMADLRLRQIEKMR